MSQIDVVVKSMVKCKICASQSEHLCPAEILRKYAVNYFRCTNCGFVQTESPYWLDEAYSSAIGKLDTGILSRNLLNQRFTTAILNLLFPDAKTMLDYGAGHGIFVRLMRDGGFNFSWYDLHATNDYAKGFEYAEDKTYDVLTSFEVLEHLVDPVAELSSMMSRSPNVLVSTELLPDPTPRVSDWWYYCPVGGQHIAFYTLEALRLIARRFGRSLLSRGSYHLFTIERQSELLFRLATSQVASRVVNGLHKRPSLMTSDFELMSQ